MNNPIIVKCVSVEQPIGEFYVGSIDSNDLLAIAYADVIEIQRGKDDLDKYIGIQRDLSTNRVNEIKRYVTMVDATFPTSIILAIPSKHIELDKNKNELRVTKADKVAKIIDGQHRIAGLKDYNGDAFQLNVTIFVDIDLEDQAIIFSTVNLKQTKVNKSIAYSLYEYASTASPQKTCHDIAKILNAADDSPFKDHIKILGKATGKSEESITQAVFVESLMKYITKDPMSDRDIIKRSKKRSRLQRPKGLDCDRFIFRNLFIDDRDEDIAKIIYNYFKVVQEKWPNSWNNVVPGLILNKTTGFVALMKFLKPCYINLSEDGEVISKKKFTALFEGINLEEDDFSTDIYVPGATGENDLYKEFCSKSGLAP